MKLAVIGTGWIVEAFVNAVAECPNMEIAAVYSRTQERADEFASKFGIPETYTNLEVLAKSTSIDSVYIASPNSCHFEQSILMMQNGKHVLCEKPAATCTEEVSEMLRVAKENNVVFLEASKHLFSPGLEIVRSLLPKIGTIRRVSFSFNQYSSKYDGFKQGIVPNVFKPELAGGALMDLGVYCVQFMVALFGEPKDIVSSSIDLSTGADGLGAAIATYDGFLVELCYSKISHAAVPNEIQGEDGSLVFEHLSRMEQVDVVMRNGETRQVMCNPLKNQMIYEAQAFYDMVSDPQKAERYNKYSIMAMSVMDEIKRQQTR